MIMRFGPRWGFNAGLVACAATLSLGLFVGEAAAGFKFRFGSSGGSGDQSAASKQAPERQNPAQETSEAVKAPAVEPAKSAPAQTNDEAPQASVGEAPAEPMRPVPRVINQPAPSVAAEQPRPQQASVPDRIEPAAPVSPAQAAAPAPEASMPVAGQAAREEQAPGDGKMQGEAVAERPQLSDAKPAAADQQAPLPAVTPKAAAAAKPVVTELPLLKSRGSDTITQTSYSKTRKRPATEAVGATGAAALSGGTGPGVSVITCGAGCTNAPGEVVQRQIMVPNPAPPVTKVSMGKMGKVRDEGPAPNVVHCVGGCYDLPKTYKAVPVPSATIPGTGGDAPGTVQAAASGQVIPTAGTMSPGKTKGSSGEWMNRINRERSGAAGGN